MEREALQMCLEYIETNAHERKHVRHAIQAALARPVQEPVACARCKDLEEQAYDLLGQLKAANLKWSVAHPWVGLTAEEIEGCLHHVDDEAVLGLPDFARAVEQLLKEKNNGL